MFPEIKGKKFHFEIFAMYSRLGRVQQSDTGCSHTQIWLFVFHFMKEHGVVIFDLGS